MPLGKKSNITTLNERHKMVNELLPRTLLITTDIIDGGLFVDIAVSKLERSNYNTSRKIVDVERLITTVMVNVKIDIESFLKELSRSSKMELLAPKKSQLFFHIHDDKKSLYINEVKNIKIIDGVIIFKTENKDGFMDFPNVFQDAYNFSTHATHRKKFLKYVNTVNFFTIQKLGNVEVQVAN